MRYEGVIPHRERLLHRDTGVAHRRELVAGGTIQRIHERVWQRTEEEAIDTAPPGGGTVHVELRIIHLWRYVDARLEIELQVARSAHAEVKTVGNPENGVTHLFRVEPGAIHPPEQAVILINVVAGDSWRALFGRKVGSRGRSPHQRRGLPIGRARDDEPMELFQGPARVVAEPNGQPVQQLGMRGPAAHLAEVVWRLHQAAAEMIMPHT